MSLIEEMMNEDPPLDERGMGPVLVLANGMEESYKPKKYDAWIGKCIFAISISGKRPNDLLNDLILSPTTGAETWVRNKEAIKIARRYLKGDPAFPCLLRYEDHEASKALGLLKFLMIISAESAPNIRGYEDRVLVGCNRDRIIEALNAASKELVAHAGTDVAERWELKAKRAIYRQIEDSKIR